jgi:hypothetical protein
MPHYKSKISGCNPADPEINLTNYSRDALFIGFIFYSGLVKNIEYLNLG